MEYAEGPPELCSCSRAGRYKYHASLLENEALEIRPFQAGACHIPPSLQKRVIPGINLIP